MTSRDFVYWLQGLYELGEPLTLNKKQTELIRKHLAMVFIHEIDPSMGDEEHQGKLTSVHQPEKVKPKKSSSTPISSSSPESSLMTQIMPLRPTFLDIKDPTQFLTARC